MRHIGPEEFVHHFLTLDKKAKVDDDEPNGKNGLNKLKNEMKYDPKKFPTYLEELKNSCKTDIYIEKSKNLDHVYKKSINIQAYILWFNRLSSLVCTEVVKHLDRDKRVAVIDYFIDVAYCCFQIGNYNSAMSIFAGLNSYNVSRLKKTVILKILILKMFKI